MSEISNSIELSEKDYLEKRLQEQQAYHNKKALNSKKLYYIFSTLGLILSLCIPIIAFLPFDALCIKILTAVFGSLVSLFTSILALYKYQESWLMYRNTAELLRQIEYLYKTKTPPYNEDDAFEKLVLDCESILNDNRDIWKMTFQIQK